MTENSRPLQVVVTADVAPFQAALRKAAEAMSRFIVAIEPHLPAFKKYQRKAEIRDRLLRQQLRHRDQRAARRARRLAGEQRG